MDLITTANVSSVIIGGLLVFVTYIAWSFYVFRCRSIPGPFPLPIVGNMPFVMYKKGVDAAEIVWREKYGNVFQFYFGRFPNITVYDLDILKRVLVKDFPLFTNRCYMELQPEPADKGVFFLQDETWKRVRNIMTPTFSGGKLKQMCPDINRCADLLASNFEKHADTDESLNVKDFFGAYTMDVIASTAFGLQLDSQKDKDDPFVQNVGRVFNRKMKLHLYALLAALFPVMIPFIRWMRWSFWPPETLDFLAASTNVMIEERKKSEKNRIDFLQLLLNAELDENMVENSTNTTNKLLKRLTTEEIIGQGFIFFIAGYETTGSLLKYISYLLAIHPETQEKIYEEIKGELGETEPSYENISKLSFMDQVINETLRLFPPLGRVNRQVSEDVTINGVTFPKGASLNVPIYQIHHDPDIHPDPEQFKPERFDPDNKSTMHLAAFLPFGVGPRNCIGIRLALIEAKIALIHVLRKVEFVKSPKTEIPLLMGPDYHLTQTINPIQLMVKRRE